MTALFSSREFAAATGGDFAGPVPDGEFELYTDSREEGRGRCFVALRGEKFDAHDFLAKAIESGAGMLLVERAKRALINPAWRVPVLAVDDTLLAYQALARFHRRRFPELRLAAVTGSVGKTSAKEMLRAIFSAEAGPNQVLYTLGNTNNQVGVAQNLLRLTPEHRYAVIEMGTNHHGEIEPLSRMAEPQCAAVNSIAPCHLEFLKSLAGVAEEKGHIFDGLAAGGGAVIPAQCEANEVLRERVRNLNFITFGVRGSGAAVEATYLGGTLEGSSFRLNFPDGASEKIEWPLSGAHQALNAAGAAAAALFFGIAPAVIARGLAATTLPGMRMARSEINGVTYVNDAYNANPGSMAASFRLLAESTDRAKLVLLVGDMLELGAGELAEHAGILKLAGSALNGARVIAVGPRFGKLASEFPGVTFVSDAEAARAVLAAAVRPGDLVFLKASRSIALEKALPAC